MNDIITIDKQSIIKFANEGGKLVFKPEAEASLLKLLELKDFIDKQVEEVKDQISRSGTLIAPDFKGVIGDRVNAVFRNYGSIYEITGEVDKQFITINERVFPHTHNINKYLKDHKKLPKGIKKAKRNPVITLSRKNEQITT